MWHKRLHLALRKFIVLLPPPLRDPIDSEIIDALDCRNHTLLFRSWILLSTHACTVFLLNKAHARKTKF